MASSNGVMGMSKHRGTGWKNGAGKSPKMRHAMKRDAEKSTRPAKPQLPFNSVAEAFKRH